MTLQEIDAKLDALRAQRARIEGTETEVYARIVGYYRSVRNWNKGKKEEYAVRLNYADFAPAASAAAAVGASVPDAPAEPLRVVKEETHPELGFAGDTAGYLYFYRKTCPNCPPVASWLEHSGLEGRHVDVDRESGLHEAGLHDVTSAPTVIFLDADGRETGRGSSVSALDSVLGLQALAGA